MMETYTYKEPKESPTRKHVFHCKHCGAEFGILVEGNVPAETFAQCAATVGWHSVDVCGKCAPPKEELC